jgi:hypothetical protein
MTDQTSNGIPAPKQTTLEYRFYFAVIFLISLPWELVSWMLGLASPDSEDNDRGFLSRAWRRAAIITPTIFSA